MADSGRLRALREAMSGHALNGYLQPVHDEYMSEYPPASNQRVAWLSGFTGSAGSVAVLNEKAALFTDGRYSLQAVAQVDIALFPVHNSGNTAPEQWLAQQCQRSDRIGYDARLYTRTMIARMQSILETAGIELVACDNLVDVIWLDRPKAPATPLFIHEDRYNGESSALKRQRIGAELVKAGADLALLTTPDAVNWLLNIRARDVKNTPLALAVALLYANGTVQLYVNPQRADAAVATHLGGDVTFRYPEQLVQDFTLLQGKRVWCDPQTTPLWFMQQLEMHGVQVIEKPDPCLLPKAIKNPVQLTGIRAVHIRDGAAVCRLLCWLEAVVAAGSVSEIQVVEQLLAFRALDPGFVEPSFATISGSGPNGAIVHYHATPESNRDLQKGELFLLDSGGQYPEGTTDITRTVPIGQPTAEQRDRFTRVLKGHIALASAIFPAGTTGSQLDVLARQHLWQAGLDYDHGTGHGVGQFLGVHEGPQRISKRGGDAALLPGMIVSNEPGYYKTGAYGIRIENLVAVVEKSPGEPWLGFDTLTCVPIDTRLIHAHLLNNAEKHWLNRYHRWVQGHLSHLLESTELHWLHTRCQPI